MQNDSPSRRRPAAPNSSLVNGKAFKENAGKWDRRRKRYHSLEESMFNVLTWVDEKGREPRVGEPEWLEDQTDTSDTCKHAQDIEND